MGMMFYEKLKIPVIFLPKKQKKDDKITFIPESLKEAVRVFILICTIRILRGQQSVHNSMLVNISRFTGVQSQLRILIRSYVTELRDSISNFHAKESSLALENTVIKTMYRTWLQEYGDSEFSWEEVQFLLNKAISKIEVVEVNSSAGAEKDLDFTKRNYPHGRSVIAIGGLSLSRGITLEGLSTTYFLRNSIMYDTLMQMGRWFGYRFGL